MSRLAEQITMELQALVGKPLSGCGRAADMQMFGFGPLRKRVNRKGEEIAVSELDLHVQCRWRIVDAERILFGRDDLLRPADESISLDDFDWDEDESALDAAWRPWFAERRGAPLHVVRASGDRYGGFRIVLERDVVLETFPCHSKRGEYSEHWRLFGHRPDGSHFVITGYGVEDDRYESSSGG